MADTAQPEQGQHNRKRKNNSSEFRNNGKSRRRNVRGDRVIQATITASRPLCSVCNTVEEPKYKCPKCRDTYCSIQCCRDHKAQGCSSNKKETADSSVAEESSAAAATSRYLPNEELEKIAKDASLQSKLTKEDEDDDDDDDDDDMEEGWKLTDSMTEAVKSSQWLKAELKDQGLRHLISRIVAASALTRRHQKTTIQQDLLEQFKADYPRFNEFLDKLLVTTDVLERHGEAAEMDLKDWLKQEGKTKSSQLVLKPVPTKEMKRLILPTTAEVESSDESESSSESSDENNCDSASSSDEGSK